MKNPCKKCGGTPKYKYSIPTVLTTSYERYVVLECDCGNSTDVYKSDPTALKYWNEENPV